MHKPRILAVDDDRFFREWYTDVLQAEGYEIDAVADAAGCFQALSQHAYDVVILDLILEDCSGIELAAQIRDREEGLEIIMATKVDDLASINRALELGIKEYLLKPIKEAEFLQTVARIIERQRVFLEHGRLVAESVEHFTTLSIYRRSLAVLGNLELEPLVDALLEGCMRDCEAAGVIMWLRRESDSSTFREVERRGLVDADEPKEFSYSEYPEQERLQQGMPFFPRKHEDGGMDRDAVHIPLIVNKELLALVKLCGKVDGKFRTRDLQTIRLLAEFSSIALQNCLAVRDLKRRASRGEDFVLSPSRFAAVVERERATALRYNRAFSLVQITLGKEGDDLESFLEDHLREADVVTRVTAGVYKFFLPETDGMGARSFIRRLVVALRAKGILYAGDGTVPAAHAAFPADGETMEEIESALEHRLTSFAASPVRELPTGDFTFLANFLLERKGEQDVVNRAAFLDAANFVFTDMQSDPRRRSALFTGLGKLSHPEIIDDRLPQLGPSARVSIFGDAANLHSVEQLDNVATIQVQAPSEGEFCFILYLTAETGYVLLYRKTEGKTVSYQKVDPFLADTLILALQEQYFLQRQL